MKFKNKYFIILIIISIIFTISAVSANDNHSDIINDENNIKLNQNFDNSLISENNNEDSKLALSEKSASFNQFCEDLNNSEKVFNLNHSYTHDELDEQENAIFYIDNLVINGNNYILDGNGSDFCFKFYSKIDYDIDDESGSEGIKAIVFNITINDLTFVNFNDSPFHSTGGNIILNNVTFTNCTTRLASLISIDGNDNVTINNCNFYSNSVLNILALSDNTLVVNNSKFNGNNCFDSAIIFNRGSLTVENSIFENFTSVHGSAINYKGDGFTIRNTRFMNLKANSTGGAIIAKYFPKFDKNVEDSYILSHYRYVN